jgi:hypothetical protein
MVKEYNPDVPGIIQILWIIINSKVWLHDQNIKVKSMCIYDNQQL